MKMQIVGIELSEGVSSKSGTPKAYSIGQLHTLIPLAPARGGDNIAKGFVGSSYECDGVLLKKLAHLPFPITADVTLQDVSRFGKRQQLVVDILPGEVVRKAA